MAIDPLLENVRLAVACGADPAMVLTVALAAARPATGAEAFAMLDARRTELLRIMAEGSTLERLAELEPEIQYEPEISRLRPEIADHEVRGRLLFRELLGQKSFFQVAALLIAGIELSASDAELLEHGGVITQLADPRIWPLTVTRRTAAHGGGLARSLVAGVASLCTPNMTALPVAGFMRFLDRLAAEVQRGRPVETVVDEVLSQRERIPGLGRPVMVDERVPQQLILFERYGRGDGPSMQLAKKLDRCFHERKGLHVNSAGFHGALMRDMSFAPNAAAAFCMIYFIVPLLAHGVYADERRLAR